jgi:hypothetical protein
MSRLPTWQPALLQAQKAWSSARLCAWLEGLFPCSVTPKRGPEEFHWLQVALTLSAQLSLRYASTSHHFSIMLTWARRVPLLAFET